MTGKFIFNGLGKSGSVTCRHNDDIFWATSAIPKKIYDDMFKFFKESSFNDIIWKEERHVILSYEKVTDDGTPIDAKAIEFHL